MKFTVDKHEKYVLFKLNDTKFTNDNTPKLKSELILLNTDGYKNIIIDLSSVKQCNDSQDLSCLLFGSRMCKNSSGLFIVTGVNDVVAELLAISQLDKVLTITPTVDEAIDLVFMEELEKEFRGSATS